MLLDRSNWDKHRPWFLLFLVTTLASIAWYGYEAWVSPHWPGGSSLPGFIFGVVGGLLCLFEFGLWLRKKVRAWRLGSARAWLRAHIWLGLLTLPLLVLHSGLRFGGALSTILLTLLIMVVASGIWGWGMQNYLPERLLEEIPLETIPHQVHLLGAQLEEDAWTMVAKVCGLERRPEEKKEGKDEEAAVDVGMVRGPVVVAGPVMGCQPLASFFEGSLSAYFQRGREGNALLAQPGRAKLLFDQVRTQIPPEAHAVLNTLEGYCNQRRQWDRQVRIHFWLHNWLWVHFPLSVALIVLMFVHVFVALKYY